VRGQGDGEWGTEGALMDDRGEDLGEVGHQAAFQQHLARRPRAAAEVEAGPERLLL